ncbi:MAG TPA: hypothetical protein VIO64_10710 [Pseudobacteroides sp.]|uniref:hypothetical protein n=1 Tax=Pseudobacteroides sp. TaxID=1968840 RepID=UPI002F91CBED
MISYTVNCYMFFLKEHEDKANELYNILSPNYALNLDNLGRGRNDINTVYVGETEYIFINFWSTFADKDLRDELLGIIKGYKQYCWSSDFAEYQRIQAFDTYSKTFGSPLDIAYSDEWGMMC